MAYRKTYKRPVVRRRRAYVRPAVRRRRTVTRRSRAVTTKAVPKELTPSTRFVLAQIDPFEPRALGAKIPDSNTIPSLANSDCDQVAIPQPSSGNNLIARAFLPSYRMGSLLSAAGTTSVVWSGTWENRRNYSNVVAQIEAFRPVGHAIRICSPLAPTSATGFVHVGLDVESRYNDTSGGTANSYPDFPTTVNQMTGLAFYKRVTLASLTQSPLTVINKWIDDSAFRYQDPREQTSLSNATENAPTQTFNFFQNWATIIVMVEGAPTGTGTCISVEHLLLSEAIPKKDSYILGSPAAPNSSATLNVVSSMAAKTDFAHTEAQQESYVSQAVDAVYTGAAEAGAYVFENVALPIAQSIGRQFVGTAMNMAVAAMSGHGGLPGIQTANRLAITK